MAAMPLMRACDYLYFVIVSMITSHNYPLLRLVLVRAIVCSGSLSFYSPWCFGVCPHALLSHWALQTICSSVNYCVPDSCGPWPGACLTVQGVVSAAVLEASHMFTVVSLNISRGHLFDWLPSLSLGPSL